MTSPRITEISTHALRMEGDFRVRQDQQETPISTHALRMEGDMQDTGTI